MKENEITRIVIECAMKVHSTLGPGLLESAYQTCLYYELSKTGLKVEKEKPLPIVYDDVKLDCGYRIDLFVEDMIVVELKSIDTFSDIHLAQVLTYLKLADQRVGLMINFNVERLKYGIKRVINGY
ncbi:GxxExxY protein [Marinifilum sp. D714]|uniref:GxxExxY protein n=1 Tax=Marinifilum sp. D714 TaxID=2937523 RepID=UPI0027CC625B|nr:GxxExxY protein [Marinifilum sp. D714]MDQ2180696.1 GxxExxY protein [Marinifilum sp. D714]